MSPLRSLSLLVLLSCMLVVAPLAAQEPEPPPAQPEASQTQPEPPKVEQPDPDAAAKEQARARFERGLELARSNAWDAALAEFLTSLELYPTRGALKNAAFSLKELHRYDEALDAFETLLQRYPELPADERAMVDRELADLATRVGQIDVLASEPGAIVIIDGRSRQTPARVAVGSRLIRVHKEGFLPFEQRVEIAGGKRLVVKARLRPLIDAGRLRVSESSGNPAQVFVDGALMGKAPWEGTLATGSHVVWLVGAAPKSGTQPAQVLVKRSQLEGLPLAVEPLEAVVRIEASPASATIALDGVPITTGLWEGPVRSGGHLIEVSGDGHLTAKKELSLATGERRTLRVLLELDPESARFKAEHPARIVLDADAGVLASSALGSGPAEHCTGSCSLGQPLGVRGTIRGGYQLGIGLGGSLDLGFLQLQQSIEERAIDAANTGFITPGTITEDLSVSLWTVGASVFYHTGSRMTLLVRLGGGAAVGSFDDERAGGFAGIGYTDPHVVAYQVSEQQTAGAPHGYGQAALRVGYALTEGFELGVGLDALILVATKTARWDRVASGFLAKCALGAMGCDQNEAAYFSDEDLQSKVLLSAGLGLGARYAF